MLVFVWSFCQSWVIGKLSLFIWNIDLHPIWCKIYILASRSLTILSLLRTALFVVDDVSTLSSSESVGSDPVAVWKRNHCTTLKCVLTLIASLSSLTNASIAVAMASSRVTCSLRLLFSAAEQVTESGVAAIALPRAATFVFVLPLATSLASSVLVLITSAQEPGVEMSLPCLEKMKFQNWTIFKGLWPWRPGQFSTLLFGFLYCVCIVLGLWDYGKPIFDATISIFH